MGLRSNAFVVLAACVVLCVILISRQPPTAAATWRRRGRRRRCASSASTPPPRRPSRRRSSCSRPALRRVRRVRAKNFKRNGIRINGKHHPRTRLESPTGHASQAREQVYYTHEQSTASILQMRPLTLHTSGHALAAHRDRVPRVCRVQPCLLLPGRPAWRARRRRPELEGRARRLSTCVQSESPGLHSRVAE